MLLIPLTRSRLICFAHRRRKRNAIYRMLKRLARKTKIVRPHPKCNNVQILFSSAGITECVKGCLSTFGRQTPEASNEILKLCADAEEYPFDLAAIADKAMGGDQVPKKWRIASRIVDKMSEVSDHIRTISSPENIASHVVFRD